MLSDETNLNLYILAIPIMYFIASIVFKLWLHQNPWTLKNDIAALKRNDKKYKKVIMWYH